MRVLSWFTISALAGAFALGGCGGGGGGGGGSGSGGSAGETSTDTGGSSAGGSSAGGSSAGGSSAGGSSAGGSSAGGSSAGGSSAGGSSAGGSGSGGEAGATTTTIGIVSEAEPRSGLALVAGGEISHSENFTMIATFGEEPGGNRSMHSDSNRLNLGVVGATQP